MKKKNRVWWWVLPVLLLVIVIGEFTRQTRNNGQLPARMPREKSTNTVIGPYVWQGMSTVAIVQSTNDAVSEISVQEIEDLVRQAVSLAGGLRGVIRNGDTVVLKPNLVVMKENNRKDAPFLSPDANGITTDWRVTRAVVRMVRELNPRGKIYIMECTADQDTVEVMKHLKYTHEFIPSVDEFIALEQDSGEWKDEKAAGLVKVSLTNGLLHKAYYINKRFFEADVLISLPCLKTHSSAVVTGALKNTGIGAAPANVYGMSKDNISKYNMVNHLSDDLHKWIRDYNLCKMINFTVMDGLQGLQNGPTHNYGELSNDQMNMRLIIAGKDPVAVDTVEALLAGWDPSTINYLNYLSRDRAGNSDVAGIQVVGKRVDEVRKYLDGMNPLAGGRKIFDHDAPEFKVKGVSVMDGGLSILMDTEKDVRKVEIYIDDNLTGPVITNDFNSIFLKDFKDPGGTHQIRICVYDRFLNRSEQTVELK